MPAAFASWGAVYCESLACNGFIVKRLIIVKLSAWKVSSVNAGCKFTKKYRIAANRSLFFALFSQKVQFFIESPLKSGTYHHRKMVRRRACHMGYEADFFRCRSRLSCLRSIHRSAVSVRKHPVFVNFHVGRHEYMVYA